MHIIKVEHGTREYWTLVDMVRGAARTGRNLRLSADGDGVMVKVGGGLWTAPLGSTDHVCSTRCVGDTHDWE